MKISNLNLNSQIAINKENKESTGDAVKQDVQEEAKQPKLNQKSADEVLSFMAQTSDMSNIQKNETKKTVQVSKYVTPDQAKRISGFVQGFTGQVEEGLKTMDNEFGNMPEYQNMSDSSKMDLAVGAFAQANL